MVDKVALALSATDPWHWTRWGLSPGPPAREADVIPLRQVPLAAGYAFGDEAVP